MQYINHPSLPENYSTYEQYLAQIFRIADGRAIPWSAKNLDTDPRSEPGESHSRSKPDAIADGWTEKENTPSSRRIFNLQSQSERESFSERKLVLRIRYKCTCPPSLRAF